MSWQGLLDTASLVTAVCAVLGVLLAAILGWLALHVAKSGNDTARKAALYGQVDDVLDAALGLTSASSGIRDDQVAGEPELHRAIEAFDSRLRMLGALGLLPEARAAVENARSFAGALASAAKADDRLNREGRAVLGETLLSGEEDDHTEELLREWTKRYCAVPLPGQSQNSSLAAACELVVDPQRVPPYFGPGSDIVEELSALLSQADWEPRASASLRLFFPWAQVRLGVASVGLADGEPIRLFSSESYPERVLDSDGVLQDVVEPRWSEESLNDWLARWSPGPVEQDINGQDEVGFSPEEMSDTLLKDLRAAFLGQVVVLVEDLRTAVSKQQRDDAGWMRKRLGLA